MRRVWLVLALISGVTAQAEATPLAKAGRPAPCPAPLEITRQEPAIVLDGLSEDRTPPAPPTEVQAVISKDYGQQSISVPGNYSSDTASIHVDVYDRHGLVHIRMKEPFTCLSTMWVAPDAVNVAIRAVDAAGNESAPFTTYIEGRSHIRCGTGMMGVILVIPFLLVLLPLGLLIARAIRQARLRRTLPEPVSLLAAESITRSLLRVYLIVTSLGFITMMGAFSADADFLGMCCALAPLVGLRRMWKCRTALRVLDREGATAERRMDWLIVEGPRGSTQLHASEGLFRAGQRAGVPTVTAL